MRAAIGLLGVLVSATGCASGPGAASAASATTPAAAVAGRGYVATLQAQNSSGSRISGTVKLTPTAPGEFRAEVSIRNAGGMQNKYPWVIRSGQCGIAGATDELGNRVGYRILETASDGSARITAPLKVEIPPTGVFHVAILMSPTDRETVVACGVLSAT